MSDYIKQEIFHTAFALAVTVLVAVAADLTAIQSFKDVSLIGLVVTGVRSLATAVVTLRSRYVLRG